MTAPYQKPPVTEAMREQAKMMPNSWLPVAFDLDQDGTLQSNEVMGRYRVDIYGEITDEYVPNPRYLALPPPPVSAELRELARSHAGGWVEVVDPAHSGPDVPPSAVVGRYPVDSTGSIVELFEANPDYRPSPLALGWPVPRSELEAIMQRAHIGQGDMDDVRQAALTAELVLPADPTRPEGEHLVPRDGADRRIVDAFVADSATPEDWPPHWQRLTGAAVAALVDKLGEPVDLLLHGAPDLRVQIPGNALRAAAQPS
ncbi:type VII secretion system-associated protein [Actinokineospora iranica]|uniref:SseB protein N-terminal domain-containing protein n=1 Tax=Actinokineospora iranica TaxID=1271860 RepID=A0A1G6TMU8_9PSEU|nr:type VII secretion system-associated protein [Actinokineospora iranica]SDD29806.1 hypothetical protein SAMN05216174_109200 [Actinokineospora iranica]